jgi:hypothetical protein
MTRTLNFSLPLIKVWIQLYFQESSEFSDSESYRESSDESWTPSENAPTQKESEGH